MEGTALLAQELGERLRALGMSDAELAACRALLEQISVVPEARIAAGFAGVRAMHDVTEGGLATALRELAAAAGHGIIVAHGARAGPPRGAPACARSWAPTRSGSSARAACSSAAGRTEADALLGALAGAGIAATDIGEVGEAGAGVTALERGRPAPWPEFAVDEAARILGGSLLRSRTRTAPLTSTTGRR